MPKSSGAVFAIFIARQKKIAKTATMKLEPNNPDSSPMIANIESFVASGRYPYACRLFPSPRPINPPLPTAIRACFMW